MKVALIEIGGSHDECLNSHIKILQGVADVTLICNESLRENVKAFEAVDKKIFVTIGKGYKKWASLFRLWRLLRAENFDKVIFNTAHGNPIRILLSFPYPSKTKFYGVAHDIKKLNSSSGQKLISKKISHYFVLSDYLIDKVDRELSLSAFYPVFFPKYQYQGLQKKEGDIWVTIPGQVELKRRDYQSLFESIKKYGLEKKIKFLLLGRYGHAHGDSAYILDQIAKLGLADQFFTWENFIPVEEFHGMIAQSDYILPLIHQGDKSGDLYENQISGAFNLAIGYKKPLIVEQSFAPYLEETMMYEINELVQKINQLTPSVGTEWYTDEKWTLAYQKQYYLKAIGLG